MRAAAPLRANGRVSPAPNLTKITRRCGPTFRVNKICSSSTLAKRKRHPPVLPREDRACAITSEQRVVSKPEDVEATEPFVDVIESGVARNRGGLCHAYLQMRWALVYKFATGRAPTRLFRPVTRAYGLAAGIIRHPACTGLSSGRQHSCQKKRD